MICPPRRLLLWMLLPLLSLAPLAQARPVVAEAGDPIRGRDGRIDIPATIDALTRMRVNTYLYTVWQHEKDLDDLGPFAAAAMEAKIQVWVYLLPWSVTKADRPNSPVQHPYANDYPAWLRAIGELSRKHPNITAWVMDDFWENVSDERFNEDTVAGLVRLGKRYNPELKFFPIVYFAQPWAEFIDRFGPYIDGVIACYPQSTVQIDNASTYLRDGGHGPSVMFSAGSRAEIAPGTIARARASVEAPPGASLVFYFDEQSVKPTGANLSRRMPRHHRAFVRVDGREVWADDIARPGKSNDGIVTIPLPQRKKGKYELEVGIEFDKNGSTGHSLRIRFDDIRIIKEAARRGRIREYDSAWKVEGPGQLHPEVQPASEGGRKFDLPMMILFGTEPNQHEKRHNEPGTPENVAAKLRLGADSVKTGQAAGIVGWYTPKQRGSKYVDVFAEAARTIHDSEK